MELPAGASIGAYDIVSLLGRGGMGEVYLARDSRLERDVALKLLPTELLASPERRARFSREAKLASRLVHPNAAVIYEAGQFNGADFLAMEYVDGETLRDRLNQKGPLPLAELLDLSIQLADVLHAAHLSGLVHRDIKPGNIMLTRAGQMKLLDFGLARLRLDETSTEDSTITGATPFGAVLGTPEYLSPEQFLGRAADHRSDIFSAGVVLYQMAAAVRPFSAAASAGLANVLQAAPEPLVRRASQVPPEFERIVFKCLEKSPANRYQSAGELLIDLRNLRRGAFPESAPSISQTRSPRRVNRRAAIAAGSAVALAGLGLGAWKLLFPGIRSLAVLPLSNSGPADSSYLSDGFTEGLINQFAQIRALRVLARSTVYNKSLPKGDPQAAGKRLGVDVVLSGAVDPAAAELSFALALIASRDGRQLWGETVRIASQAMSSAAAEIARRALVAMGLGAQDRAAQSARPVDPDVYRAYLRGRYLLNQKTAASINASIEQFRQALDRDPAYAPAYAQMAAAFVFQTSYTLPKDIFPKAQAAAERALDLDANLAEAHNALALIRLYRQWDWNGAETSLARAIDLNPSYAAAHTNRALVLTLRKRFEEAVAEVNASVRLDPLSPLHPLTLGSIYYQSRQFDRAVQQYAKALDNDKNFAAAYLYRGTAYIALRRYDRAIADFDVGLKLSPDSGGIADQGLAYARVGNLDKAREAIARIEALAAKRYVSPYVLAFPHLGLGETARALDCLERAAEDRSGWIVYSGVEPKLDPLRSNPRFQRLVKLIGAG